MASIKLTEEDDTFLNLPQGALVVASGSDGAETWIERCKETTVRVVVASVAVATGDGASLEAAIEVEGDRAHGSTGPAPMDTHLQTIQSVQLTVSPEQKVRFRAYASPVNARLLKTVVYTHDLA
jgi:hypothetical protein